jgi:precorrin-3B methylase
VNVGSLTVVGIGFGGGEQITAEASQVIGTSEKVLYLVADTSAAEWIRAANPTSESLGECYFGRANRLEAYVDLAERILSFVRRGLRVCAVFYGHPGVLVFPSIEAIIRAREEGFDARMRMLPGISAADCLFADLGLDPGLHGCLTFDATDFLVRRRAVDLTVPMILWQVGAVGRVDYPRDGNKANIKILSEALQSMYGPLHEVVIYEARVAPGCDPLMEIVCLEHLAEASINLNSTVYVPPLEEAFIDEGMARRLAIPEDFLLKVIRNRHTSKGIPWRPYSRPRLCASPER